MIPRSLHISPLLFMSGSRFCGATLLPYTWLCLFIARFPTESLLSSSITAIVLSVWGLPTFVTVKFMQIYPGRAVNLAKGNIKTGIMSVTKLVRLHHNSIFQIFFGWLLSILSFPKWYHFYGLKVMLSAVFLKTLILLQVHFSYKSFDSKVQYQQSFNENVIRPDLTCHGWW